MYVIMLRSCTRLVAAGPRSAVRGPDEVVCGTCGWHDMVGNRLLASQPLAAEQSRAAPGSTAAPGSIKASHLPQTRRAAAATALAASQLHPRRHGQADRVTLRPDDSLRAETSAGDRRCSYPEMESFSHDQCEYTPAIRRLIGVGFQGARTNHACKARP